jgi:hypothetical protein
VTDGVALEPLADAAVPSGIAWSTPVNETAPPTTVVLPDSVTTTLAAPEGGAVRYHMLARFWFPPPSWSATLVRAVPP